jgi:ADP-ribose pyrophosphatase
LSISVFIGLVSLSCLASCRLRGILLGGWISQTEAKSASMRVIDVEILESELLGDGGFVRLRRCVARNVHEDGSRSPRYALDLVERPRGIDAVTVLAYERSPALSGGGGRRPVRVLLHRGLRPAPRLGRAGEPPREGTLPPLEHVEAVAGLLEAGVDPGEEGLRRRAAEELLEETGLRVDPGAVAPLGPPALGIAGLMAEKIYFAGVETDLGELVDPRGDGSLLEEGSSALVLDLEEALSRCRSGEIADAKTEVALRRLAELLATAS